MSGTGRERERVWNGVERQSAGSECVAQLQGAVSS